jgi:hypothetical protein
MANSRQLFFGKHSFEISLKSYIRIASASSYLLSLISPEAMLLRILILME